MASLLRLKQLFRNPLASGVRNHGGWSWVEDVRSELESSNRVLEKVFLDLGDHLAPLSDQMEALLQAKDELASLATGRLQGRELFGRAVELLQGPMEHLNALVSRQGELLGLIDSCVTQTASMLRFQEEMQQTLAPLSYIEVLFKVETASLDEDVRDTFFAVSGEIARLRRLVNESFQRNAEALAASHRTLSDVRHRQAAEFESSAARIENERSQIALAIGKLDGTLRDDTSQDRQTEQMPERLAAMVSEVVSALQAQDIVRQRCEHVTEGLSGMQDHGRVVPEMVTIVLKQLTETRAEALHSFSSIRSGLTQLEAL